LDTPGMRDETGFRLRVEKFGCEGMFGRTPQRYSALITIQYQGFSFYSPQWVSEASILLNRDSHQPTHRNQSPNQVRHPHQTQHSHSALHPSRQRRATSPRPRLHTHRQPMLLALLLRPHMVACYIIIVLSPYKPRFAKIQAWIVQGMSRRLVPGPRFLERISHVLRESLVLRRRRRMQKPGTLSSKSLCLFLHADVTSRHGTRSPSWTRRDFWRRMDYVGVLRN
jgi:hypothetical protein